MMSDHGLLSRRKIIFRHKLPRQSNMRIFNYERYKKSRDILSLASGIFELEKELKKNHVGKYYIERYFKKHNNKLKRIIKELVSYVLLESIDIEFDYPNVKLLEKKYSYEKPKRPRVTVLFSGGVDSLSGILWAKKEYSGEKDIEGVFCAHSDQARNINIVNTLSKHILLKNDISLRTIHVPPITKSGYAQLRGFLYILSAAAWMDIEKSDTIVISECGPTMYQPKYGLFDIVTMTTHPEVIHIANQVLKLFSDKKIRIVMPFENMTKAEVISLIPNKSHLRKTHSCVTQRFGKHDGTCYGCVIRRLGAIVAGANDVEYLRDPISNRNAKNENLLSLLLFSQDILVDYESMPLFQIEDIEAYDKKDLFRRFALDNFAALRILKKKRIPIVKDVDNIYQECLAVIGPDILDERIKNVRNQEFNINLKPI